MALSAITEECYNLGLLLERTGQIHEDLEA